MSDFFAKRERRPVVRENYIEEEELDQILMKEYGLSQEELDSDLEIIGRGGGFLKEAAEITQIDGSKICLHAEAGKENYVLEYLDQQSSDEVDTIWRDKDNRAAIASLIRYPGRQHEWLMVAVLPLLKRMEIPLVWMHSFRTETNQCIFYYQEDGQWYQGQHGGAGSTRMHNALLKCFVDVYQMVYNGECQPGKEAEKQIAAKLEEFAENHFDDDIPEPDALQELIQALNS